MVLRTLHAAIENLTKLPYWALILSYSHIGIQVKLSAWYYV